VTAGLGSLLLAVETATAAQGVALLRGEQVVATWRGDGRRPGSEALLPGIQQVLAEVGVEAAALEGFAVSIGPGSFTGLRVAIATIKGLAFGAGACVAPVPTLEALAARAETRDGPVAAVLDARRGDLYGAVYGGGRCLVEAGVYRPEAFAARLPADCAAVVGEGIALLAPCLGALSPELLPPPAGDPDPAVVGRLGVARLRAGKGVDAAALVPFYGRRAAAEAHRIGSEQEPEPDFDTSGKLP